MGRHRKYDARKARRDYCYIGADWLAVPMLAHNTHTQGRTVLYGLSCGYWTDDINDRDQHIMKHVGVQGIYALFEHEASLNPPLRRECIDGVQ